MDKITKSIKDEQPTVNTEKIIQLPRGGYYVKTCIGPIQFGIPPETIKDALNMKIDVPQLYVCGVDMFDRSSGVSTGEVEFPSYYNFFIKKRKTTIICPEIVIPRINMLFQQTVFGPDSVNWDMDFDANVPEFERPMGLEYRNLRKMLNEKFSMEDMIEFVVMKEDEKTNLQSAEIDTGCGKIVKIVGDIDEWLIFENDKPIAGIPKETKIPEPKWLRKVHQTFAYDFEPPMFGVTVLGSSHGFDPKSTTTGFVLWMNGRGIMVDPPLNSADALHAQGIPSLLIEGVIVTHCHADHDGGTFQKILEQRVVKLITTHTILHSFIKKYSAISGFDAPFLRKLFTFIPAVIGQPMRLFGGELRFFYSVHTLPTIGFVAYLNGKSIYYSSDMCHIPDVLNGLVSSDMMTRQRADMFLRNTWNYNMVLHEAGVPPIHTPVSELMKLPDSVKARLHLVHISEKDVPKDSGIRLAYAGVENTIVIPVTAPEFGPAIRVLGLLDSIDCFRKLPLSRAREILQVAETESYPPNSMIVREGTPGDKFYIVERGAVEIIAGERTMVHDAGSWFGETSLITDKPRTASVRAKTQVTLITFRKHEFLALLRDTDIVDELVHLSHVRNQKSWETISSNSYLSQSLSTTQRVQLQSMLNRVDFKPMEKAWSPGDEAVVAYIIESGDFQINMQGDGSNIFKSAPHSTVQDIDDGIPRPKQTDTGDKRFKMPNRRNSKLLLNPGTSVPLERGNIVGDISAMLKDPPDIHKTTFVCTAGGSAFSIERKDLLQYYKENPGIKVAMIDSLFLV